MYDDTLLLKLHHLDVLVFLISNAHDQTSLSQLPAPQKLENFAFELQIKLWREYARASPLPQILAKIVGEAT